jgi:lipoate-protein ligase B
MKKTRTISEPESLRRSPAPASHIPARALWFDAPIPYPAADQLQSELVAARLAGRIPDTVLFLEHPPVITLGVRGTEEHVLEPRPALERRGVLVARSTRGGEVTYHGPGQLVIYPILKLEGEEADVRGYIRNLEELAIRTAADFGVRAFRRKGMTGAWTRQGKLAAIGVRLKRWVTSHGMSFNVNIALSEYRAIVPCGLPRERVTSLRNILGDAAPPLHRVRRRMARHFAAVLRRHLEWSRPADLASAGLTVPFVARAVVHQAPPPVP